jgi:hypothetical protein
MKFFTKIFIVFLIILQFGCEDIEVIQSNIPFEESYVINGRLVGNTNNFEISFTKSFAIESDLTRPDVILDNVITYVLTEDQGVFVLNHTGNGKYSPVDTVDIRPGSTYELYAKIGTTRISAVTLVPSEPDIFDASIQGNYVTCNITPEQGSIYGCKYMISSISDLEFSSNEVDFYELSDAYENSGGSVNVRTNILPDIYFNNPDDYIVYLKVYAFDEAYKSYYETRENNKPIENIFSEGGGSVYWNVNGNKTIGMFIGYTYIILNDIK